MQVSETIPAAISNMVILFWSRATSCVNDPSPPVSGDGSLLVGDLSWKVPRP